MHRKAWHNVYFQHKYIRFMVYSLCQQTLIIMEIKKTELEEPIHGYNVFVKHTVQHQDFWTRGFLIGNEWIVMTWSGKVKVPKRDIKEWMPIPGIRYS